MVYGIEYLVYGICYVDIEVYGLEHKVYGLWNVWYIMVYMVCKDNQDPILYSIESMVYGIDGIESFGS